MGKKLISKLYTGVESPKGNDELCIKEKWETEANIVISLEECEKINEQLWKTTCSLSWREYGWKNVIRFFKTLAQKKYDTKRWSLWGKTKQTTSMFSGDVLTFVVTGWN